MLAARASIHVPKSKRGQALVELLPSVVIFLMVMTGALAYFKALKSAMVRQEAVRNLAFARIDNMGTLTVSPQQLETQQVQMNDRQVASVDTNSFVRSTSSCFAVSPAELIKTEPIDNIYGANAAIFTPLKITTYAVVYRLPPGGQGAACNY